MSDLQLKGNQYHRAHAHRDPREAAWVVEGRPWWGGGHGVAGDRAMGRCVQGEDGVMKSKDVSNVNVIMEGLRGGADNLDSLLVLPAAQPGAVQSIAVTDPGQAPLACDTAQVASHESRFTRAWRASGRRQSPARLLVRASSFATAVQDPSALRRWNTPTTNTPPPTLAHPLLVTGHVLRPIESRLATSHFFSS